MTGVLCARALYFEVVFQTQFQAPVFMRSPIFRYDHETCTYVPVTPNRTRSIVGLLAAGLVIGFASLLVLDRAASTPEELALMSENDALRSQLEEVGSRIDLLSGDLSELKEHDSELFRTLFAVEDISSDVRQVGTGGSEPYPEYGGFRAETRSLLVATASRMDQVERQLSLQNESYRELSTLASEYEVRLAQMPAILPVNGPVTSGFGMRKHPVLKVKRMHGGLDFHAPRGTPVHATGNGVIIQAGTSAGYGRFVKIRHEKAGLTTVYSHLSRVPRDIRRGVTIERGSVIGFSGDTGLANAPHLHYEVRDLEGRSLNPVYFFAPSMTPDEYERLVKTAESTTLMFD